jgi:pilus assembly protein CpaB
MNRRVPLIVGLILAVGTGFLLLNYLTQGHRTANGLSRSVVVTTKEIPARAKISADMLGVSERQASEVDSDAIADPHDAVGKLALITMPAGSAVTGSKISTPAALALPTRLGHGLRAVSIAVDRVKGVSGLIEPGDRVDVIAVPQRVGSENPRASTILRGVLVLALGNTTETAAATPAPDNQNMTTVTLAVNPQQANLLALADVYTTLRLALRSPDESTRAYPAEPIHLGSAGEPVAAAAPPMPQYMPPPAAPAPIAMAPAPKPAVPGSVPIVEGDRIVVGSAGGAR